MKNLSLTFWIIVHFKWSKEDNQIFIKDSDKFRQIIRMLEISDHLISEEEQWMEILWREMSQTLMNLHICKTG